MDTAVFVGPINYVDYERAVWPGTNIFWPFVNKRLSFAYEAEVRAIICQPQTRDGFSDYDAETPTGRLVGVDLAELIESIFVPLRRAGMAPRSCAADLREVRAGC
jgi:hypothetical protein